MDSCIKDSTKSNTLSFLLDTCSLKFIGFLKYFGVTRSSDHESLMFDIHSQLFNLSIAEFKSSYWQFLKGIFRSMIGSILNWSFRQAVMCNFVSLPPDFFRSCTVKHCQTYWSIVRLTGTNCFKSITYHVISIHLFIY